MAYFIFFVYILLFIIIKKQKINNLYKALNILGIVILFQIILGIFTVLNNANIIISSLHQISSIFLVSSSVYLLFRNKYN